MSAEPAAARPVALRMPASPRQKRRTIIAKAVVPLANAGGMTAELIAARTDIPWLGDQFARRDSTGSCSSASKKPRAGIEAVWLAARA